MADKINVVDLDINIDSLISKQATLLTQITTLRSAQSALRKETENLTEANDEQTATFVKQDADLKKLNAEYNRGKGILSETTTGVKGLNDALTKQIKTEGEAKKSNKELIAFRQDLNAETVDGAKAIKEINSKINENNAFIKNNVSGLEQQRLGIGAYTDGIIKAVPGLEGFVNGLKAQTDNLKITTKTQEGAITSTNAFRVALIAIPIFAIIAAVALLVKAFASTQKGMDEISKVTRTAQVVFDKFFGLIQNVALGLFDDLKAAIDNPIEALKNLGDIIVNNVINRFKAFAVLGDAVAKLIKGDFSGAAKTATDGFIQMATGIEGATDKISGAAKSISEFVKEAEKEGLKLDSLIKRLEQREIDLTVPLAKARNELKGFKQEAEDVNKTETERLKALQKAVELQGFITKSEQELKDLAIERKELENSFNDTSRADELELQKLIAERYELETAGIENLTTLQNLRNTITNQQLAKQKAEVAEQLKLEAEKAAEEIRIAKDKGDRIAAENKQRRAIEFETELLELEERGAEKEAIRIATLNNQRQLAIEDAAIQIQDEELREQAITNINRAYAKERVDIQVEEALARYQAQADVANSIMEIFGKESQVGKAAALFKIQLANAEALAYGIAAAQRVPFPANLVAIFSTIAAVTSNIRKSKQIISGAKSPKVQKFATGTERVFGEGSETSDSIPTLLSKNERVMSAKQNRLIGFDLSNDQLVNAAQFYKSFVLNGLVSSSNMSDRGIIAAVKENTITLKNKPVGSTKISKDGIYNIVSDGQNSKVMNQDYYLG